MTELVNSYKIYKSSIINLDDNTKGQIEFIIINIENNILTYKWQFRLLSNNTTKWLNKTWTSIGDILHKVQIKDPGIYAISDIYTIELPEEDYTLSASIGLEELNHTFNIAVRKLGENVFSYRIIDTKYVYIQPDPLAFGIPEGTYNIVVVTTS